MPHELTIDGLGLKKHEFNAVKSLLDQVACAVKDLNPVAPAVLARYSGTVSTLTRDASYANRALAIASDRIGFPCPAVLSVQKRKDKAGKDASVHVRWSVPSESRSRRVREGVAIRHIFWIKNNAWGEYVDLMIRGAHVEAETIGAALHVILADPKQDLLPQAQAVVPEIAQINPRQCVFVLDLIDIVRLNTDLCNQLPGYRVITSGYAQPAVIQGYPALSVIQHNAEIGRLAAITLAKAIPRGSRAVVSIVCPTPANDTLRAGPVSERVTAFKNRFMTASEEVGFKYSEIISEVKYGDVCHPHDLCEKVPEVLAMALARGNYDTVNLFFTMGDLASLFIPLAHMTPWKDNINVVAADIMPTLIAMLGDNMFPLNAICGVDPISYGRKIVRAACNVGANKEHFPEGGVVTVSPVLLTRDEAQERHIRHTFEVFFAKSKANSTGRVFA